MENQQVAEEAIRINKYLAECGICSRREADRLVEQGKVSVDGKIALQGYKVLPYQSILVKGKPVRGKEEKVVLAYYKPVGVTCTEKDAHAKITVTESLHYKTRVTYAGRLDKDSEGLLLMTNDGDLSQAMMKSGNFHQKEYVVKIDKKIENHFLEQMQNGVYLKELKVKTRPCVITKEGENTFRIILTQGLNRQIRRMCEALGCRVIKLKRVRVISILLGNLKSGEYREIKGQELKVLYEIVYNAKH